MKYSLVKAYEIMQEMFLIDLLGSCIEKEYMSEDGDEEIQLFICDNIENDSYDDAVEVECSAFGMVNWALQYDKYSV